MKKIVAIAIAIAFSLSIFAFSSSAASDAGSSLAEQTKKALAKKVKRELRVCEKMFTFGSTQHKICKQVVETFTGSVKSGATGGVVGKILAGVAVFLLVLSIGLFPVFMLFNRIRRFKKYSKEFKYFLKKMSY